MHVFEMVLYIVVAYFIYKTITDLSSHKAKQASAMSNLDERVTKIEELEERIKVLEKIVTDKNYDLEDQINKL